MDGGHNHPALKVGRVVNILNQGDVFMSETGTIQFEDRVRSIGKKPGGGFHTIVFNRHAAFYTIDSSKTEDVNLLQQARTDKKPILIECNPSSLEIVKVSREETEV